MAKKTLEERFLSKIIIDKAGCWLWQGNLTPKGYGRFRKSRAHRESYMMFIGPIPTGMCVCHLCDVRKCVNPKHLWLGTVAQNQLDMKLKGRGANFAKYGKPHPRLGKTMSDDQKLKMKIGRDKYWRARHGTH